MKLSVRPEMIPDHRVAEVLEYLERVVTPVPRPRLFKCDIHRQRFASSHGW
jgi:hypothetical protein